MMWAVHFPHHLIFLTMKHFSLFSRLLAAGFFALMLAVSCAPINSTFETASTVPKGRGEFRGNFSYYRYTEKYQGNRESGTANTNLGIGIGMGLVKNVDLKLRYELLVLPKDTRDELGGNGHFLSLAPKVSFGQEQIAALKLPIGAYFSDFEDAQWVLSPQLLVTPVRKPNFDFTMTGKMDFWLGGDVDEGTQTVGFTIGAGLGKNVAQSAFRPEIGFLFNPGESGVYLTVGVGYTALFGGKKAD